MIFIFKVDENNMLMIHVAICQLAAQNNLLINSFHSFTLSLFHSLIWYQSESPIIFPVGRNGICRFGTSSPTIVSCQSLLLHVNAYFHEVAWGDIVDMVHSSQYIPGSFFIVIGYLFR
jgi:hypothetical protein